MKISVDYPRCEGHGMCTAQAPAVFELGDAGELTYRFQDADIPEEHLAAARAAIGACPVAVLREQP
ncbi:ferredoxin [Nocardia arthritidis]|uniref:ferredoxin n=1 Tax=Nocardia arthritidis TaxID=228602 RepID=UPI0007A3E210|nr:ferredoxin [Nocardia arthritidis]